MRAHCKKLSTCWTKLVSPKRPWILKSAFIILVMLSLGIPVQAAEKQDGNGVRWNINEKIAIFGLLMDCAGESLVPWGLEKNIWTKFLERFGFIYLDEAPWRENSRDLGRRWLYEGGQGIRLEVYERGSLGVALALPLVVWTPGQPQPPGPRDLAPLLEGVCDFSQAKACPEGGLVWQRDEGAMGIIYQPPAESESQLLAVQVEDQDYVQEDVVDVLLLVAYGSAHVVSCGAEE